jgi:hypothetical protein
MSTPPPPAPAPSLDVVTFGEVMAMFIANESGPLEDVATFTRALAGAQTNVAVGPRLVTAPAGSAGSVTTPSAATPSPSLPRKEWTPALSRWTLRLLQDFSSRAAPTAQTPGRVLPQELPR